MVRSRLRILVLLALTLIPGLVVEVEIARGRRVVWDGNLGLSRRRV